MKYLMAIASTIEGFLNGLYASLTTFFQSINLDSNLAVFCEYHLLISFIIFAILLVYFVFFDKKQSIHNFEGPKNLIICLCLFFLYTFLSDKNIQLSSFGLGVVSIHAFILIIVGKMYGPLFAAAFGAAEYFWTCINDDAPIMFSLFFIYAIGGMLHGWVLYEHRTSFWRCLVARLITVLLCNVILIPFVRAGIYTHEAPLSVFIPQTITTNILQVPVQALIGYVSLLLIKLLRRKFEF